MSARRNNRIKKVLSLLQGPGRGRESDPIRQKLAIERLQAERADPDASRELDQGLLNRIEFLELALGETQQIHKGLQAKLEAFTQPPLQVATLLSVDTRGPRPQAVVRPSGGNGRVVVNLHDDLPAESLLCGDEVCMNQDGNLVLRKSFAPMSEDSSEVCAFEHWLDEKRLVVSSRDEKVVARSCNGLIGDKNLKPGDLLTWDSELRLVRERLAQPKTSSLFIDGSPEETFEQVAGLGRELEPLFRKLELLEEHGLLAARYGVSRFGAMTLHGPNGCGKTLLARALANRLARRGGESRFLSINPGSLLSQWYGQTERKMKETFAAAAEAANRDPSIPVVMFFDEIDALGLTRGGAHAHVDDRVLSAFLTELDGFHERSPNLFIVAATNRLDALDPALIRPGRLGDLVIRIPRPNRPAAGEILARHLSPEIPFHLNGSPDASTARESIIQRILARFYAPNADPLAVIQFRDGKKKSVRTSDILSGAIIANAVRHAAENACHRELETGAEGIRYEDVEFALLDGLSKAAANLTPRSVRDHVSGLPNDRDIVEVVAHRSTDDASLRNNH